MTTTNKKQIQDGKSTRKPAVIFQLVTTMKRSAAQAFDDDDDMGFSLKPPSKLPERKREVRCENAWQRGFQYEGDESFTPLMKYSINCAIPIEGKYAYVDIPTEPEWLNLYIQSIERLTASQVSTRNGTFTWIIYRKSGEGEIRFAASKVSSVYEIATIHRSIAKAVGASTIHGAGELKKDGNTILANFQSGTYMQNWIRKRDPTCTLEEMEVYIYPMFQSFFPGFSITRVGDTFIKKETMPPTMAELQLYADAHFIVCVHDSYDTCKKVGKTCDNPLKPQPRNNAAGEPSKAGKRTTGVSGATRYPPEFS